MTPQHIEYMFPTGTQTIVAGDLNAKHLNWGCNYTNPNGKILHETQPKVGITLFAPTRPTHYPRNPQHRPDILDITLTNTKIPISVDVLDELSSDHLPTIASVGVQIDNTVKERHTVDWQLFQNTLIKRGHTHTELSTQQDIDTAIEQYTQEIKQALKEASTPQTTNNSYQIIPTHIRKVIQLRNWIRKQWQRTQAPHFKAELNSLNKKIKKLFKEHNVKEWEHKVSTLCTTDCTLWKMAKTLKSTLLINRPIQGEQGLVYSEKDKAEVFADCMKQQFTLNKEPKDDDHEQTVKTDLAHWYTTHAPTQGITETTLTEITDTIRTLKVKKAPGHDEVGNKALKHLPNISLQHLKRIINSAIKSNYFPTQWKRAVVILFQKPGKDPTQPQNYRPISLLTSLSKIFERILYARLLPELDRLPDEQFGFRKNLSTTKQLVKMMEFIGEGLHNHEASAILMLDQAKAFDRVWHQGLIHKLIHFGLKQDMVHILDSYLTNRTFTIRTGTTVSTQRPIQAGVPQGSILGPILYLIYIADFPILKSHDRLTAFYADDAALVGRSLNANLAIKKVQAHIPRVEDWCKKWKISINASKSNLLVVRKHKTRLPITQKVKLFDETVPLVKKANYLGLVINSKANWTDHIKHVKGKASGVINKLRPLIGRHSKLSLKHKKTIYNMYIRPIMTYASPAWATCTEKDILTLQRRQNKTLREMTDAPWFLRNTNIHRDLNIEMLGDHIHKLNTGFYTKALHSDTANYKNTFSYELLSEDTRYRPFASFSLTRANLH